MSLYKPTYKDKSTGAKRQINVWWFEFVFGGVRYRESTHTTRKPLAVACERRRRLELERIASSGVSKKKTPEVEKLCQESYKRGQRDLLRVISDLLADVASEHTVIGPDDLIGLCDYMKENYLTD